ncbi:MAG TPA: methyltransferase, partial [Rhodobacteraceae bacterium]|nr:methyltransferase [Paracoccaceae bacterium]
MSEPRVRRAGGRSARQALRAAPIAAEERSIRAGMEGGTYKPLSDAEILRIHNAALNALENIGLADAPPSGVKILTDVGAIL